MTERMTAAEYRRQIDLKMSEAEFQSKIIAAATKLGWIHYHTHRSDNSPSGFPDLVLINMKMRKRIISELKKEKAPPPTEAQEKWLDHFRATTNPSELVTVWRPSDWPEIERALRGDFTPEGLPF